MGKISRDTPLAEITLRRYEKPTMNDRDLVRRFCLSIGLLQPGDSRDVVVDVLQILLKAKQRREELHSEEIKNLVMSYRKESQLPMLGIASSNIRRQLKRLKDLHLIETNANLYRISEWNNLAEIFDEKIHNFLLQSVISRVKDYVVKIDEEFSIIKEEEEEESYSGQKNLFETPVRKE
ncbi:hypothetical protein COV12_01480 [Candidatus Woesearchaeota archaeon CG10_big_fil_rev_8_21_14_0_10_32_24]|nr:MAG: hypothetical protein COV12_01480 [Candidatus Woesearchaeota archaeon CG10_big_fil_rev_8_21_14_0_10_32_24]